jgi:lysophospholipase L1-like esterase
VSYRPIGPISPAMQTLDLPTSSALTQRHQPAPRPKSLTQRWVVVGDSLVYGYGDPIGGGWVERLRRQGLTPGQTNPVVYNLGVRGDGVRQVALRLEDEFRCRGELRNQAPDLLILSVGVNDSPRLGRIDGRNFLAFDAFRLEMAELLDRARRLCPVLFVGSVPVRESAMPFLDCLYYNHADQARYQEATRTACEARHIPYLDVFERWQSRGQAWCHERLSDDGLHPNVLGHETLLAEILDWPALQDWRC